MATVKVTRLSCLVVAVALWGCDDCNTETDGTDIAIEGSGSESTPATAVTEDGLQVVLASQRDQARRDREEELRQAEREHLILEPNEPDPHNGEFTLTEAVEGMGVDGQLVAEIGTDMGTMFCDLEADRAPKTVANFIGLARGLRAWWDPRAGQWVKRPYYHGLSFFRVLPEYLIQTGDFLNDGTGGVGYEFDDEIHEELQVHDRAGLLCMANRGPNTNGAQFLITDGRAPELDGSSTIFGRCQPEDLVAQIARVPQDPDSENRPLTAVNITRLRIRRVEGGAENATPTMPAVSDEGFDPDVTPRGATAGPSERQHIREERRRAREALQGVMH